MAENGSFLLAIDSKYSQCNLTPLIYISTQKKQLGVREECKLLTNMAICVLPTALSRIIHIYRYNNI